MKKSKIVKIGLIALSGIIVIGLISGFAIKGLTTDVKQLSGDKAMLISDVDAIFSKKTDNLNATEFQAAYKRLEAGAADFSDKDLAYIIKDNGVSDATKSTVLQLSSKINGGKGIKSSVEFLPLLEKGALTDDVRVNLINNIVVDTAEVKTKLAEIATSEEGAAVMRALVKLEQNDALAALNASNKILGAHTKYNADNLRAAVTIKSDYFKELTMIDSKKDVTKEKQEYISLCKSIYSTANDKQLKNAVAFGLMNMRDFEAVKFLLTDESVDEALKVACISRNPKTFIDKLNANPTAEEIELIISSMEKVPLKEVAPAMREKLYNGEYHNSRVNSLLQIMEAGLGKADTSRFEGTPTSNWLE